MTDIIIKISSAAILVFVIIINLFGNIAGVGDIIPTGGETTEVTEEVNPDLDIETANEVAALYEAAVQKTKADSPAGTQKMALAAPITGDGTVGALISILQPMVEKALANNSQETDWIPGANGGALTGGDIADCSTETKDGKTTVYIRLKNQTDGADCDSNTAGPVARGIGTLGSIDAALEELGAELNEGRETVVLTYRDAYIECVIDNETGKITEGEWHYVVDVKIGDVKAKLGILAANLKNFKTSIEYTVEIG